VFPALGQEQLGVLRQIHRYPSTRWTASSTRDGWNGFTTKSLAPPGCRHERLLPHRTAHQDLGVGIVLDDLAHGIDAAMSGITMSIVTRSGLSCGISPPLGPVSARDDLESGLRQDVADHRPHEDGVVADENAVAHCSLP